MFKAATNLTVRKVTSQLLKTANFGTYKSSTGLAGLAVDKNGRETLNQLANKVLVSVKRLPETASYRQEVEQWYSFIAKVTTEKTEILDIENEIELGQIEEVIDMTKNEIELIDFYLENNVAEVVKEAKLEADDVAQRMADSIYFSSPDSRFSHQAAQTAAAQAAAAAAAGQAPAAK